MDSVVNDQKKALRASMRDELTRLSAEERQARSTRLVAHLVAKPAFVAARRILLFAPLPIEPNLDLLWAGDSLQGKECAYPRVVGSTLRLYFVEHVAELRPTRWGLREPEPFAGREAEIPDFDLVLVPGVAFDRAGGRLGRGGGYYDRLISGRGKRSIMMGIAFEVQCVDAVPLTAEDARMDSVCTEAAP